jgi:hypothetical protein
MKNTLRTLAIGLTLALSFSGCLSTDQDSGSSDSGDGNGGSSTFSIVWKSTVSSGVQSGCLGPFTLGLVDGNGNPTTYPADSVNIELQTNSDNLVFYSDSGCSVDTSNVTVVDGNTESNQFYVSDLVIENTDVEADFENTALQFPISIIALSTTGDTLGIGIARSAQVGACSGPVTFQLLNSSGTQVNSIGNLDLSIYSSSSTVQFYTDAGCSSVAESNGDDDADIFILAGTNSVQLYYYETTDQNFTVSASSEVGSIGSTVSVSAGVPETMELSPGSGGQNDCIPVVISFVDQYDNATTLSGSTNFYIQLGGGGFNASYSDSGCNNQTSTINGSSGSSSVTFWVKDGAAENLSVEVDSNGLNPAETSVSVSCSFWSGC